MADAPLGAIETHGGGVMAYATVSPHTSAFSKQTFTEPLLDSKAVDEYARALCGPLQSSPYGSRKACPHLSMLVSNVSRGTNRVVDTTLRISFATLALRGEDEARRIPRVLDALICARTTQPESYSLEDLQGMECEVESLMNPVQWAFMRGDKSPSRQRQLLELVNRSIEILLKMKAALERSIYGAKQ